MSCSEKRLLSANREGNYWDNDFRNVPDLLSRTGQGSRRTWSKTNQYLPVESEVHQEDQLPRLSSGRQ